MPTLSYLEVESDIQDRLQRLVDNGHITESERQLLISPSRIVESTNAGLLLFCLQADPAAHSDLVSVVTLSSADTFNGVAGFEYPATAYTERADRGILSVIVAGNELGREEMVSYNTVEQRSNSSFYTGNKSISYNLNDSKKRIYAPSNFVVKAKIFLRPVGPTVSDILTYDFKIDSIYRNVLVNIIMERLVGGITPSSPKLKENDA